MNALKSYCRIAEKETNQDKKDIFLLVLFTIIWSVKQVTINRNVTDTISYGK